MCAKEYNIYIITGYTRTLHVHIIIILDVLIIKKTVYLLPARRIKDGVQIKRINFTVRNAYKLSV